MVNERELLSVTLAERIAELIVQHGSLRAVARVLECDGGYLSRLQSGEKDNPDDWLLRRMGLRRVVTYERVKAVRAAAAYHPDRGGDPAKMAELNAARAQALLELS